MGRVIATPSRIPAPIKLSSCFAAMPRSRVPLEQLQANLETYYGYLLQDPCANPRALAYVEARIGSLVSTNSRKSDSTDSGELAGLQKDMSSSGRSRSSVSRERELVTT